MSSLSGAAYHVIEHMAPEFMSSPFAEPTPKPNNIKFGPSGK